MTENTRALKASVIVPTYNRRDRLQRLLLGLDRALGSIRDIEVVVVVDGATDGTMQMLTALRTDYPLRVVWQPNSGPAAARNRAIAAAVGDVLIFLDDDVVPTSALVDRHLEVHCQDTRAIVIGPMLAPPGRALAPWLKWEAATLQKQYNAMIAGHYAPRAPQFFTANASVRREHVLAVGAFDERFMRAEDVELAHRLEERGLRFYFLPEAAVLHEPDRTFESWLRVGYEYGRHEVLMEQTSGRRQVRTAYEQFRHRHLLNRLLPRWCVGRPQRLRAVLSTLAPAVRHGGRPLLHRVQLPVCSALFTTQYWQGVADATGHGPELWRELERERRTSSCTAELRSAVSMLTSRLARWCTGYRRRTRCQRQARSDPPGPTGN